MKLIFFNCLILKKEKRKKKITYLRKLIYVQMITLSLNLIEVFISIILIDILLLTIG